MRRSKTVAMKAWQMNLNVRENHMREEDISEGHKDIVYS